MAHLPGLSEEEEKRVYELTDEINRIDKAVSNINDMLHYYDGQIYKVSGVDLEVIMKSALKYQKELVEERSKYQNIIEENTPAPSFK